MRHRTWIAAVLSAALFVGCAFAEGQGEEVEAAVEAAEAWLALVDEGKYDESWSKAASYFRQAVDKATWRQQMVGVREPLGKKLRRSVRSSKYVTSAPGAPDGEYVVIQTDAQFENKSSAVETVTPMRDSDGRWRVSGYYIK